MGQTIRRLGALGLKPWVEPRGGLFLWARLPDGLDAADIARYGLKKDVVFAPGDVFSLSQTRGRVSALQRRALRASAHFRSARGCDGGVGRASPRGVDRAVVGIADRDPHVWVFLRLAFHETISRGVPGSDFVREIVERELAAIGLYREDRVGLAV